MEQNIFFVFVVNIMVVYHKPNVKNSYPIKFSQVAYDDFRD
jgi:hypothetical protein